MSEGNRAYKETKPELIFFLGQHLHQRLGDGQGLDLRVGQYIFLQVGGGTLVFRAAQKLGDKPSPPGGANAAGQSSRPVQRWQSIVSPALRKSIGGFLFSQ